MLYDYLPLAILFILAVLLAGLVVLLGHAFGPRRPTKRKSQPYESGMTPIGNLQSAPNRWALSIVLCHTLAKRSRAQTS